MAMHGRRLPDEKAKDFKGTLKKLFHYMNMFKAQMILVAI